MPDQRLAATATDVRAAAAPRVYYLHPLLAGPLAGWPGLFADIAALGFSHVLIAPPFATPPGGSLFLSASHTRLHEALRAPGDADTALRDLARAARAAGLVLLLDLVADRVAAGSALATAPGTPFMSDAYDLNPTRLDPEGEAATASLDPAHLPALIDFWRSRLLHWVALGVGGIRLLGLPRLPAALVRGLANALTADGALLLGWTPGVPMPELARFAGCGFDYVFSSLPWWDGRADWFWQEQAALRALAPVLHPAEAPFGARLAARHEAPAHAIGAARRGITLAALLGPGWLLPMGAEFGARQPLDAARAPELAMLRQSGLADLTAEITALNKAARALPDGAAARPLAGPGANPLSFLRLSRPDPRLPGPASLIAIDTGGTGSVFDPVSVAAGLGGYFTLDEATLAPRPLPPGGHCLLPLTWHAPAGATPNMSDAEVSGAAAAPRIGIESISPTVDAGTFPARFCVGERVMIEADLIGDGHEILAAVAEITAPDGHVTEAVMRPLGNDRWQAGTTLASLGAYRVHILAWKDVYASFCDELHKKAAAALDVTLEIEEGRALLRAAAGRMPKSATITAALKASETGPQSARVAALLGGPVREAMRAADARPFLSRTARPIVLEAERTAARFASWYEIFPRSMSNDTARHGTFDDVIRALPRIRAMGFDVLYFPPIHPIGRKNRKGRNNALTAEPGEPGSPYGIADHKALHPELGTFEDFARLRDAALAHGLEIALDFAIQCAPDHPWLATHPGWFDWRPDGSIKYAENPPKKYQDIVNVDFYARDAVPGLWRELCEIVLFWCAQGVRIFRVDNPHTKPLPFWQWMIGVVRARHPDAIFLAEAFTRPKMMRRLAKIGFSQSYTYFTWRNTKAELTEYLTELTETEARLYFRPHFFVNTPDINPPFLQNSGRAGHLIRAVLAATLAGLWGVYSGFELCEATPLPGREEYLDSEKYQLRAWDWDRPGNIVPEISRLNQIRAANPALHSHLGLTFLTARNDAVMVFEKASQDRANVLLIAVSLDPFSAQEAWFELPLWRWGLPDDAALTGVDLFTNDTVHWQGKWQFLRIEPWHRPFGIWRLSPA